MNSIIKEQLDKVIVELPEYDNNTTELIINKQSNMSPTGLLVGDCYLIEIANYVLNPPQGFTLQDNWNNGIIPQDRFIKCEISQIVGKMVKINGCGYDLKLEKDLASAYIGLWIPIKSIKIIEKL